MHGGFVTLIIAVILISIMATWFLAKRISHNYTKIVKIDSYKKVLAELSVDLSIPKYATHLVYMTNSNRVDEIEEKVMYSILQKRPKRADIYWFIHVNILNEPYRKEYRVTEIVSDDIYRIDFYLGFREPTKINLMFKEVIKFVLSEKFLSNDSDLTFFENIVMNAYFFMKKFSLSEEKGFGLDSSSVKVEQFPMVLHPPQIIGMKRLENYCISQK
jgi:KUP system potassium uptake protein